MYATIEIYKKHVLIKSINVLSADNYRQKRRTASRAVDRLDLAYGAAIHSTTVVYH